MASRLGRAAVAALAVLTACLVLTAGPASADPVVSVDGPGAFQRAQVGLTFTVYSPTGASLPVRTGFELRSCALGVDAQIVATYGTRSTPGSKWLEMHQSDARCQDSPDGIGPATTLTVRGLTVKVMGACSGGRASCAVAPAAAVERNGYMTVTLPSAGSTLDPAFIEISSQGFTVAQLEAFVRSLRSVV